MSFTHLHLHTQYSLLDGAIKVKDLVERTTAYGMNSVAMTDHGNMFGAVDFFKQCKRGGVKPIIGCEVYVVANDRHDRSSRQAYHLILLSRNLDGYRNLVQLVSQAYLEGFYYHPRIDKKLLKQHSEGLIGMTACLGGEIPRAVLAGSIHMVHLKNSVPVGEGRMATGLADGAINHREYLRLLRQHGFSGPICIEAPRAGDREWFAQQDIAYLKALLGDLDG